jgi:hypothetical protein
MAGPWPECLRTAVHILCTGQRVGPFPRRPQSGRSSRVLLSIGSVSLRLDGTPSGRVRLRAMSDRLSGMERNRRIVLAGKL